MIYMILSVFSIGFGVEMVFLSNEMVFYLVMVVVVLLQQMMPIRISALFSKDR